MRDFSSYDLIIDARCPREYEEDHIPGAVNMPVVNNDEYAEVGTLHRTDKMAAYGIGVRYALINIARHIAEDLPSFDRSGRILVYCFRGGKRSKLWADALETIGYEVDKLAGGWKAYRRWVFAELDRIPRRYNFNVLSGSTGSGKTRLLYALKAEGAQVLDLEALARHRGSIIGAIPKVSQPSQKYFDSQLLHQLSQFDPTQPVWVEDESKKIGNIQLPDALLDTMREGQSIQIETEMAQRVLLWREDYRHFEEDPLGMLSRLKFLRPLVGGDEFTVWEKLANEGQMSELFERLMTNHYDPAYRRSVLRNFPNIDTSPLVKIGDVSITGLQNVAELLLKRFQ